MRSMSPSTRPSLRTAHLGRRRQAGRMGAAGHGAAATGRRRGLPPGPTAAVLALAAILGPAACLQTYTWGTHAQKKGALTEKHHYDAGGGEREGQQRASLLLAARAQRGSVWQSGEGPRVAVETPGGAVRRRAPGGTPPAPAGLQSHTRTSARRWPAPACPWCCGGGRRVRRGRHASGAGEGHVGICRRPATPRSRRLCRHPAITPSPNMPTCNRDGNHRRRGRPEGGSARRRACGTRWRRPAPAQVQGARAGVSCSSAPACPPYKVKLPLPCAAPQRARLRVRGSRQLDPRLVKGLGEEQQRPHHGLEAGDDEQGERESQHPCNAMLDSGCAGARRRARGGRHASGRGCLCCQEAGGTGGWRQGGRRQAV